jgi:hypothetical protein
MPGPASRLLHESVALASEPEECVVLRDHAAGGGVNMDRDVVTGATGNLVELQRDLLDRLVTSVERRTQHGNDTVSVLIAAAVQALRIKMKPIALHRHHPRLDIPIARFSSSAVCGYSSLSMMFLTGHIGWRGLIGQGRPRERNTVPVEPLAPNV